MSNSFLSYNLTAGQTAEAKTVCPKPCILRAIVVNKQTAGAIIISDGGTTGGNVGTIASGVSPVALRYDVDIKKSLVVTPGETGDISIIYKPSA